MRLAHRRVARYRAGHAGSVPPAPWRVAVEPGEPLHRLDRRAALAARRGRGARRGGEAARPAHRQALHLGARARDGDRAPGARGRRHRPAPHRARRGPQRAHVRGPPGEEQGRSRRALRGCAGEALAAELRRPAAGRREPGRHRGARPPLLGEPHPARPARRQERARRRARELAARPRHAPGRPHARAGARSGDPDRRPAPLRDRTRRRRAGQALPLSMLLRERRIIVTGGASGIAAATVRAYAREGARVASLDVNDEGGRPVAAEAGPDVTYYHCDVARRAQVDEVFARAAAALGGLDVLVNVAGVERGTPAEDIPDAEWDLVFDVNVKGTLYTNQAAFRHLREHGGRIINFGSGAGIRGQRGSAHYSAAKGAVMAWTRTVAQEWARHGITVNSIVPAIWTPMYDAYRARMSDEERAIHDLAMQHVIPLGGRLGDPEGDLAPVMVFLAGDGARFITGQAIAVDGGMIMLG